jgi:hypothetical protein
MQRASRDGNKKMMKAKSLLIWSSSDKFTRGTRPTKKLKHKIRRKGRLIWM